MDFVLDRANYAKLLLVSALCNASKRTPGRVSVVLKNREHVVKSCLHAEMRKGLLQITVSACLLELKLCDA